MKNWIIALALCAISLPLWAKDVYVTDELSIFVRSGPTREYRIIGAIKSGTKLALLETNAETGHSKVKYGPDKTGWVLTKELQSEPVARMMLAQAKESKTEIEQEREATLTKLGQSLIRINELQESNTQLNSQVVTLEKKLAGVQTENMQLQSRSNRDQFYWGAAVMFIGVVIGAIVRRAKPPRRRESW